MVYDPKTNTITVHDGKRVGDLVDDLFGWRYIERLKKASEDPLSPPEYRRSAQNDWRVIEEWLGCENREPNESDWARVDMAWYFFFVVGVAPMDLIMDREIGRPPEAVMDVFGRWFATDEEIMAKQKNALATGAPMRADFSGSVRPSLVPESSNRARSDADRLKGNNVSRERLPIAIAAIWLLLSIPLSIPIHEEFFRGYDFLSRIFSWLIVGAGAWVPLGWRWLTDNRAYPKVFVIMGVLCGVALVFLFLNDRYLDEYFYIPFGATVAFATIAFLHDGMRIFSLRR